MYSDFEKLAIENGDRLKIISIEHLKKLKEILISFKEKEELNNFQKWIINKLYQFEIPKTNPKINSIILVAVQHPFYAKVNFTKNGKKYYFFCLVRADFEKTENYISNFAMQNGYFIKPTKNLPLKRLAVHSGLGYYGRNNITYIDDLGSNFSYIAYFSDMICEDNTWHEIKMADTCIKCNICLEKCTTDAIIEERFLIDNQKCLSYINEVSGKFPD